MPCQRRTRYQRRGQRRPRIPLSQGDKVKLDIANFRLRMQQTIDKLAVPPTQRKRVEKAFVMGAMAHAESLGAKVAPKELVALMKEVEAEE